MIFHSYVSLPQGKLCVKSLVFLVRWAAHDLWYHQAADWIWDVAMANGISDIAQKGVRKPPIEYLHVFYSL